MSNIDIILDDKVLFEIEVVENKKCSSKLIRFLYLLTTWHVSTSMKKNTMAFFIPPLKLYNPYCHT